MLPFSSSSPSYPSLFTSSTNLCQVPLERGFSCEQATCPPPLSLSLSLAMPDAEGSGQEGKEKTFYSLRDWMLWLLFSAIEHEEDTTNIQLLLHGMLVSLQDIGRWDLHTH